MADVVQMKAVDRGVANDEVDKGRENVLPYGRRGGIEIEPARSHSIETPIGFGQIEVGIIEQRTTESIDENRAGAQIANQLRVAPRRQREHIDPGVNAHSSAMCGFEKLSQDIDGRILCGREALDEGRPRVEGSTAAIDLDEEIGRAQTTRAVQERFDSRRVIKDAIAALGKYPEATSGRPSIGGFGVLFGMSFCGRARAEFFDGPLPFGEIVGRTSHQAEGKNDRQAQMGQDASGLNFEESQDAHTVTSRALRLNGGHYMEDAIFQRRAANNRRSRPLDCHRAEFV